MTGVSCHASPSIKVNQPVAWHKDQILAAQADSQTLHEG